RPSGALGDQQAVARAYCDRRLVQPPTEAVALRAAAGVDPAHLGQARGRETLEPRVILVGHQVLIGAGDGLDAVQVRTAIDGEAQTAREDAGRQTWEVHLYASTVGLHLAFGDVVGGLHPLDVGLGAV